MCKVLSKICSPASIKDGHRTPGGSNASKSAYKGMRFQRWRGDFMPRSNEQDCPWANNRVGLFGACAFRRPAARHEQPAELPAQPCARPAGISFHGATAQLQSFGSFFNGITFKVSEMKHLPRSCWQAEQSLIQQPTHFSPDNRAIMPPFVALKCCGRYFSLARCPRFRGQWNVVAPPPHNHDGFIQANADQPGGQLRVAAEL